VNLQLSDAARTKLIDNKETIIVTGSFTGHPKQGTEARFLDIKSGDVVLGDVKQEIHPGETAIFDQLNLNPDALARIDSQGPHILMDVYSGRRSSKNNLLDCNVYDGSLDSVHGRTIEIFCQLIRERSPRDMELGDTLRLLALNCCKIRISLIDPEPGRFSSPLDDERWVKDGPEGPSLWLRAARLLLVFLPTFVLHLLELGLLFGREHGVNLIVE